MSFLFCFFIVSRLCCTTYSLEFVAKYCENGTNNSSVFLVIPREKGFIFVENGIFQQIEYPFHSQHYDSYKDFLVDVLNDRTLVLYKEWKEYKIHKYYQWGGERQDRLLKKNLYCDKDNRYRFKRKLSSRKELGIIKLMFDRGFYVGKMDYQAYWFFYDFMTPRLEGLPPEDRVVF